MKTLVIFDPAISYFDPVLVQFAADLKWLEKYGVNSRYNFGKQPEAFAVNPAVAREVEGGTRLPVIMVDGDIVSTGVYPSRQQLAEKLAIEAPPEELSPAKAPACLCKPWLG